MFYSIYILVRNLVEGEKMRNPVGGGSQSCTEGGSFTENTNVKLC